MMCFGLGAAAVRAATSSFDFELLLLGRVGTQVLLHLALVLHALTLGAEVRE